MTLSRLGNFFFSSGKIASMSPGSLLSKCVRVRAHNALICSSGQEWEGAHFPLLIPQASLLATPEWGSGLCSLCGYRGKVEERGGVVGNMYSQ